LQGVGLARLDHDYLVAALQAVLGLGGAQGVADGFGRRGSFGATGWFPS